MVEAPEATNGVLMLRARTIASIAGLGTAAAVLLASDAVTVGMSEQSPAFVEVRWPFPRDQWGDGRAFRCAAADCGVEVSLYVRPKIGFCNCDTGVSDEAELDRVGDLELFSPKFFGLGSGGDIAVGAMRGMSRVYQVDIPYESTRPILTIAFNQACDVMVATVVAPLAHYPRAERHVLRFLNSAPMIRWAQAQLGSS